jgi:TolB-like protein/DNA-binding winged helix-turn-helix (wHTH) protein
MPEDLLSLAPFSFDRSGEVLLRDGRPVAIGRRGVALFKTLLEAGGDTVAKAELMERVWPDVVVEEANLTVQVAALRKALGPRAHGGDWIVTVPRVGYRIDGLSARAPAVAPRLPSIAVMPFDNLGGDPEQDYLADGVVEDLITALSRFKTFVVIARNSSFVFKGRAVDVREAATTLGVRYLLQGSVRRRGQAIRVSARLVDGRSGAHLWAENFDGEFGEVFDFQDRIVENVIGLIEPQIRLAEIEQARRKRPDSLDAYDLFLRALPLMTGARFVKPEDYAAAIDLLERAVALDPGFAPALAYAAWGHEMRLTRGWQAPPGADDARDAVALAERALAAGGNDAIVLALVGVIRITVKGDQPAGISLIDRALDLNPNSLLVANIAGYAHFFCGNYDEAVACHARFLLLCPDTPEAFWSMNGMARSHLAAGRFEAALRWGRRGLEAAEGVDFAHCVVAAAHAHLGQQQEAEAALQRARSLWPALTIASLLGRTGQPEGRDRLLAEGLRKAGLPEA